ncbi:MAG: peptide transporter permease [Clostridia bacterium]|nr:peptide transporter permease [Clostridia bacterium]
MFFLIVVCITVLLVLSLIVKDGSEAIIKQSENLLNDYHMVVPLKKADDKNYIKFYDINTIKKVCTAFSTTEDYIIQTMAECYGDFILVKPKDYVENTYYYTMFVYGITDFKYTECFQNGDKYLTEGRGITREDNENKAPVVMIDSEIAWINGFKIGDEINLDRLKDAPYLDINREILVKKTYEIVGIFKTVAPMTGSESIPKEIENNKIYVPVNSMYEDNLVQTEEMYIRFPSEKSAKQFQTYINEHNTYYKEFNLLSPFEIRLVSVKGMNMQKTASLYDIAAIFSILIIFISIAGLVSIIVSISLIINQRRKEIGILISMGMSVKKTAVIFITEILLMSFIAISISVGISLLPSEFIVNTVCENAAVEMSPQNLQNSSVELLLTKNATASVDDNFDYDFIRGVAIKSFFLIFIVISIGCILMVTLILKTEPMKILTRSGE